MMKENAETSWCCTECGRAWPSRKLNGEHLGCPTCGSPFAREVARNDFGTVEIEL